MSQTPFIIWNPEPDPSSIRAVSGQSSAKAHAARTSYWKKREQNRRNLDHAELTNAQGPLTESENSHEEPPEVILSVEQALDIIPASPKSLLGQGRRDPFNSQAAGRLPENVQTALEYAWEVGFLQGTRTTQLNESAPITQFWRYECTNSPTLLHLQLQLAIEMPMAKTLDQEGSIPDIAIKHKGTAYRLMRKEIQDFEGNPKNIPSDALILALFSSNFLSQPIPHSSEDCIPASPLATAQLLHTYGRVPLIPGHTMALRNLVEKRGGLANLRQGGIADLIQLHDLRTACQTDEWPLFPWIGPHLSMSARLVLQLDEAASKFLSSICSGFNPLRSTDPRLWEILKSTGEVTVALDHHQRSGRLHPRLKDVVISANSVHHALCSLPSARLLDTRSNNDDIYELCRLATLIYSDMVLFPLPSCTGVKPRLADSIRTLLESRMTEWLPETKDSAMMLWAIFLGTIAATFSHHRTWFVSKLATLTAKIVIPLDFSCFKSMMESFLWWDFIFEEPSLTIWNDVDAELQLNVTHKDLG